MPRRNLAWLLGVVALTLLGAAVLYSAPTKEKDKDYEMVRLMVDTLHEVRERYVTPSTRSAKTARRRHDQGRPGTARPALHLHRPRGIQAIQQAEQGQVRRHRHPRRPPTPRTGGQLTVVSPMPGTPAYEAGVLAGDVIVKIDGKTDRQHAPRARPWT